MGRNSSMSQTLLNLTEHNICVFGDRLVIYPKSGQQAMLVSEPQTLITTLKDGVEIYSPQVFKAVSPAEPPLEPHHEGVIVSLQTAQWLTDIDMDDEDAVNDLRRVWRSIYVADTGPNGVVTNQNGKIIGTKRLNVYF